MKLYCIITKYKDDCNLKKYWRKNQKYVRKVQTGSHRANELFESCASFVCNSLSNYYKYCTERNIFTYASKGRNRFNAQRQ